MSQPYTKTEVRGFIKATRRMLRLIELDARQSDWVEAYSGICIIEGSAQELVEKYENREEEES